MSSAKRQRAAYSEAVEVDVHGMVSHREPDLASLIAQGDRESQQDAVHTVANDSASRTHSARPRCRPGCWPSCKIVE